MTRIEHIGLVVALLVVAGCAAPVGGNGPGGPNAAPSPIVIEDVVTFDGEEAEPAAQAATPSVEPATVQLSVALVDEASGEALADAELCRLGFEAPRGYALGGSHAPAITFVDDGLRCDASMVATVHEEREVLLAAHAPGYPLYTAHVTSWRDDASLELALPSDALLDDAYAALGETRDASASSVVVETPVEGVRISLTPIGDLLHASTPSAYLDDQGALVDAPVRGGKALFTNVATGVYEVRFEHDLLRCEPYGAGSWRSRDGIAVWALAPFEAYVGGILCNR